jgi:hypothetical protein
MNVTRYREFAMRIVGDYAAGGGKGATLAWNDTSPESGYLVGGWVKPLIRSGILRVADVEGWLEIAYVQMELARPDAYVGVWTDPNGVKFVDTVRRYPRRECAVLAGRQNDQVAVWDVANRVAVML